jgi:hypothetical protein
VSAVPELVFAHLDLAHPVPARVLGLCSVSAGERSAPKHHRQPLRPTMCRPRDAVGRDGGGRAEAEAHVRSVLLCGAPKARLCPRQDMGDCNCTGHVQMFLRAEPLFRPPPSPSTPPASERRTPRDAVGATEGSHRPYI